MNFDSPYSRPNMNYSSTDSSYEQCLPFDHHQSRDTTMIGRFQSLDGKLGSSCGFCVSPTQHYGQRSYVTIEDTDVLCGRGKTSFNHVGNRRFRDLIASSTDKYNNAKSRLEKSMVVHYIVEEVKQRKGRFLKQDRCGSWYELDIRQAKEKVGHAIRDATSSVDPKKKIPNKSRSKTASKTTATIKKSLEPSKTASSMTAVVSPTTTKIEQQLFDLPVAESADHWDDLEPLHVDSFEAQNSISELQRNEFFQQRLSLVAKARGEMDDSGHTTPPFRFEVV